MEILCVIRQENPVIFWKSSGCEICIRIPDTDYGCGSDSTWRRSALPECSRFAVVFFTMRMPTICQHRQWRSSNLVVMEPYR